MNLINQITNLKQFFLFKIDFIVFQSLQPPYLST